MAFLKVVFIFLIFISTSECKFSNCSLFILKYMWNRSLLPPISRRSISVWYSPWKWRSKFIGCTQHFLLCFRSNNSKADAAHSSSSSHSSEELLLAIVSELKLVPFSIIYVTWHRVVSDDVGTVCTKYISDALCQMAWRGVASEQCVPGLNLTSKRGILTDFINRSAYLPSDDKHPPRLIRSNRNTWTEHFLGNDVNAHNHAWESTNINVKWVILKSLILNNFNILSKGTTCFSIAGIKPGISTYCNPRRIN